MNSIYIIKNKINNKVYIGQTTQLVQDRWLKHKSDSKRLDSKLYRAIRKYGIDNFYYEILENNIPRDQLDDRERYWINYYDSYNNGYNATYGGQDHPTDFDSTQILNEWNNGLTETQIAKKLGLTLDRVSYSLIHQLQISEEERNRRKAEGVQKYDDNTLLNYWSTGLGIHQISQIYGGISTLLRKRLNNLGVTNQEIDERSLNIKKEQMKKNRIKNNQIVYQFDLNGILINQYDSIKEASDSTLIDRSAIAHCALGDKVTAGGYIWLYNNNLNNVKEHIKRISVNKKRVGQYDNNWNLIKIYDSIASAARGVGAKSASTISAKCNQGGGMAYKYNWKFIID